MKYKGLYNFSLAAAITGALITLMQLAMGIDATIIGSWTLLNLIVLGYIIGYHWAGKNDKTV